MTCRFRCPPFTVFPIPKSGWTAAYGAALTRHRRLWISLNPLISSACSIFREILCCDITSQSFVSSPDDTPICPSSLQRNIVMPYIVTPFRNEVNSPESIMVIHFNQLVMFSSSLCFVDQRRTTSTDRSINAASDRATKYGKRILSRFHARQRKIGSCGPARRWRDRAAPQTLLINSTFDIANQTIGACAKRLSGESNLVWYQVTVGLLPLT